jgi:hypothetical protein
VTNPDFDIQAMAKEPLLEELKPFLVETGIGPMIKHPLVNTHAMLPGHVNRVYLAKKERLAQLIAEGKWESYLWLHERPWRLTTLSKLWADRRITRPELQELLLQVWMDTEMPHQFGKLPERLFAQSGFISDDSETWQTLSDPIAIYRGGTPRGISWTTDIKKAQWFANRFKELDRGHYLFAGWVAKKDVYAYIAGRNESEIVAPWKLITISAREKV